MARRGGKGDRPWSGDDGRSCPSVTSYLQFYANIPDYSELHDLSDADFYDRLQTLKTTQKLLATDDRDSALGVERPSSRSSLSSKQTSDTAAAPQCHASASRCKAQAPRIVVHSPPAASQMADAMQTVQTPPFSHIGRSPSCHTPPFNHHQHQHQQRDLCRSMGALSLDSSGLHLHGERCALRPHSRAANRAAKIERKHQVPLLSRIPLFHEIMAEQEARRKIIHERNTQELQSLVQPFSFTKREEAEKRMREAHMTSSPCPETPECARAHRSHSRTPFRARPVPRDLFSRRVYEQMKEEQFYRALRNRMRADEMLKNARLPPSMEARDKNAAANQQEKSEFVCTKARRPRSRNRAYRDVQNANDVSTSNWRDTPVHQSRRSTNWHDQSHVSAAWRQNPYNQSRHSSVWRETPVNQSNSSSADASPNESTLGEGRRRIGARQGARRRARPSSNVSVSRSNLASVLRMQTARRRVERQLQQQLEEQKERAQARFKARLIRLSPAWRALDYSTDEDLALRLAQRRQEARSAGRRHRALMNDIQERVHDMPPLFQQPSRTKIAVEDKARSLDSSLNITGQPSDHECLQHKSRSFCVDRCHVSYPVEDALTCSTLD